MANFDNVMKVIRIKLINKPGMLAMIADEIGENQGNIGDVKVVRFGSRYLTRDIAVYAKSSDVIKCIVEKLNKKKNIKVIKVFDEVFEAHEGGLIKTKSKVKIDSTSALNKYFLPGVSRVAEVISKNKQKIYEYTNIGNTVAVVSNGTAVLNFSSCTTESTYAVIESLSAVLNELVDVSAVPLVIDSADKDVVIDVIKNVHKNYGVIILEDISSPDNIIIKEALNELETPIIDTNRYGNAIVTLAGLINIAKTEDVGLFDKKFGLLGYGGKASGISKLLKAYGVENISSYDISEEAINRMKEDGIEVEQSINGLMQKCEVILATSRVSGLIKFGMVRKGQIILCLSQPKPEIKPEIAVKAGAKFASDSSIFNPLLSVPGVVRGTLDARAKDISIEMMIAAAEKIASLAKAGDILPDVFDEELHKEIAAVVKRTAVETGIGNLMEIELEEENDRDAEDIFENIKDINMWMSN